MSVKALVELRDAIVSGRDSDHLRRFPGRFNLYKPVFQARGYRRGREPVFAQTARLIYRVRFKYTNRQVGIASIESLSKKQPCESIRKQMHVRRDDKAICRTAQPKLGTFS